MLLALSVLFARHASAHLACRALFLAEWKEVEIFTTDKRRQIAMKTKGPVSAETVVIFLNGIDKNMKQWDSVQSHLAREKSDWLSVQIDLLGQGRTSDLNPDSRPEIPFREQTEVLKNLIQSKGWQNRKLILVGHSYGEGIAARFARDNPGWVKEAVLIAPFVDHLETYQPGVGPMMWWVKTWSEMWGMRDLYDFNVLYGSDLGTIAAWPVYSFWHASEGSLRDMLALSRGIRHLKMNESVAQALSTKIHLITSLADELIPAVAHEQLWAHVANRRTFARLPTTHESVTHDSRGVALAILRALR